MFSNLFDGRIGGVLAVVIGLSLLGLLLIYAWRAFGRGIRPSANRGARQPRLGIVDAFDLDRHRQLVLVRRDNVEHLIMIGGPNDLLIEEAIVRAQPSIVERREPVAGPLPGERTPPRLPIEPAAPAGPTPVAAPTPTSMPAPAQAVAPSLDVKPGLEPAATAPVTPPPLRPTIEPAAPETSAPPPPLGRPASLGAGPRPLPPRPVPARPAPAPAPRPIPSLGAPRPAAGPTPVAPPAPPVAAPEPEKAPEPAAQKEPAQEPPRLSVNIDSLEEEMAKLLGRPIEPPKQ